MISSTLVRTNENGRTQVCRNMRTKGVLSPLFAVFAGIKKKVEFIAASFIRTAEDVRNLRQLLAENGGQALKIIAKIENQGKLDKAMS